MITLCESGCDNGVPPGHMIMGWSHDNGVPPGHMIMGHMIMGVPPGHMIMGHMIMGYLLVT